MVQESAGEVTSAESIPENNFSNMDYADARSNKPDSSDRPRRKNEEIVGGTPAKKLSVNEFSNMDYADPRSNQPGSSDQATPPYPWVQQLVVEVFQGKQSLSIKFFFTCPVTFIESLSFLLPLPAYLWIWGYLLQFWDTGVHGHVCILDERASIAAGSLSVRK
jgi:hypothetical protein